MGQLTPAFAAARLASEHAHTPPAEHTPAGTEGQEYTPEAAATGAGWAADPTSKSSGYGNVCKESAAAALLFYMLNSLC
jgi:hypothetical protein